MTKYNTLEERLAAANQAKGIKVYFRSHDFAYYVNITKEEAQRFLKEMHHDQAPISVNSNLPMFNLFIEPIKM